MKSSNLFYTGQKLAMIKVESVIGTDLLYKFSVSSNSYW